MEEHGTNKGAARSKRAESGRIVSQRELAKASFLAFRYSASEKTIRKWGAIGFFPVVKLSRKCVRFPLSDCDAIVEKRRVKSTSEIEASHKA